MSGLQTGRRAPVLLTRYATANRRLLPSFLIVGGKRCGSTSLYHYTMQHPMIARSLTRKASHYFDVNYSRGWRWYRSTFPLDRHDGRITGEASPYYMFHPLGPDRMKAALPEARLIAILRDPVERTYSHHQYETRHGIETLPFLAALDAEDGRLAGEVEKIRADVRYDSVPWRHLAYQTRSRYAEQLERLYELYDPAQVLVLRSEDMFTDPQAFLNRLWGFLGLPPHELADVSRFEDGRTDLMPADVRRRLQDYFTPHNERLYALPGVDLRWSYETTETTTPSRAMALMEDPQ